MLGLQVEKFLALSFSKGSLGRIDMLDEMTGESNLECVMGDAADYWPEKICCVCRLERRAHNLLDAQDTSRQQDSENI